MIIASSSRENWNAVLSNMNGKYILHDYITWSDVLIREWWDLLDELISHLSLQQISYVNIDL